MAFETCFPAFAINGQNIVRTKLDLPHIRISIKEIDQLHIKRHRKLIERIEPVITHVAITGIGKSSTILTILEGFCLLDKPIPGIKRVKRRFICSYRVQARTPI